MQKLLSDTKAKICAIFIFSLTFGMALASLMGIIVISDDYFLSHYGTNSFINEFYYTALQMSGFLVPFFIASVFIVLATFIFLLYAAGRKKEQADVVFNPLDRIPLDLYLLVSGLLIYMFARGVEVGISLTWEMGLVLIICCTFFMALVLISVCLTFAARIKSGKWWENTIIFRWLMKPISIILSWLWKNILLIVNNISLLWKGILGFIVFAILSIIFCSSASHGSGLGAFLLIVFGILTLLFISICMLQMKTLKEGAAKMAAGNLEYRIDTKNMFHDLKAHGANLNRISEGMAVAVEDRMKSEHFKTELITNVSHDLKTPLTSIINYVDLLQKEKIDNPQILEYIEILARQSAKLKKLTEDLVEASKASTGNIQMELTHMEMNEFIRQITGEYEEKFIAANLEAVVVIPEERLVVSADGRSLWRVFDNLLCNICKYSQPNTRVFIDLQASRGKVWVDLKNTSRDLLNVSAEDLMERFVRGDSSRTSEGSGLGLSIARSLTELQKGDLNLSVDGDLFKVKLGFERIYD